MKDGKDNQVRMISCGLGNKVDVPTDILASLERKRWE